MTTVTLKMQYGQRSVRDTVAWYISSSDVNAWIAEVTAWDVPHAGIRLLPMSHSTSNRQLRGVLVVATAGQPTNVSRRCIPFGMIADRLYLPVEAGLDPGVSSVELGSLLPGDDTYVWHPISGLVAFRPSDTLRLRDLLTFGPASSRQWDRAQPGVAVFPRLISIVPEQSLSIESLMEESQDDIGTQSDEISKLPRSPMEPLPGVGNSISRHGLRMVAGAVNWLAQYAPGGSSEPTWINRLEDWAAKHLASFVCGLNAARHKEISRLMHLLDTDPDRGLRFALPLSGDPHRGVAPPSHQLFERPADYDPSRFGGGQPADYWDLPWEFQCQLTDRYLQLANREIRLGRHRRAAYIFAELLGDFEAAAGTLADGGHFREAAVLYQQRLNRPLDAARCLEKGGLWMEAIGLYEELEEYENSGDLYAKLNQPDNARTHYRKAVDKFRSSGDSLEAARLLEHKLKSADEAIDELSAAWPDSRQADQCLRELFQLLGRAGRHELARERIALFPEQRVPQRNLAALVNFLADSATNYPDRSVRMLSAECTRSIVSRQLVDASQSENRQLLSAIARLVPEDRLLGRDCQRYLQQRVVSSKPDTSQLRQKRPQLVSSIQLPGKDVRWAAATWSSRAIFVAGHVDDELVVVRSSWDAVDRPSRTWKIGLHVSDSPILLAADPLNPRFVVVHVVGSPVLTVDQVFNPTDDCPFTTTVGAIPGMSPGVVATVTTAHGINWLLETRASHPTLVAVGPSGQQISTQFMPSFEPSVDDDPTPGVIPVPMHARGERVYVGILNKLLVFEKGLWNCVARFPEQIESLAGPVPNTRSRIAVTFARGGEVFWGGIEIKGAVSTPFANEMLHPVAGFNRGGFLIAASPGRCEIYSTHGRQVRFEADLDGTTASPIAVLAAPRSDQFAIVSETGEIDIYELP